MTLRVQTTRRAERQIAEIGSWWKANRTAAPDLFLEELAQALTVISRHPRTGRLYRRSATSEVRRILLPGTGFHIYYGIQRDIISIGAVWHAKRGSGPPLR